MADYPKCRGTGQTASVRVFIVPPRFDGCPRPPRKGSQWMGASHSFSLASDDRPALRTDTAHLDTVYRRSWTHPEEVDLSSTALADERRLHESALDSRSVDRYCNPDLRARNRARDRGWHRIPWTGCLLVPKAARSQDRSQSQVVPCATRFLGVLATVTRVRPRGQRVDDGADEAERVESSSCSPVDNPRR